MCLMCVMFCTKSGAQRGSTDIRYENKNRILTQLYILYFDGGKKI